MSRPVDPKLSLARRCIKQGECIIWTGSRDQKGYGLLRHKGAAWRVHRLAWALSNGAIPHGLHVLHRCDNPPCCNVAHLFLGTNNDNVFDRMAKGRSGRVLGERNQNVVLSDAQVVLLRQEFSTGSISCVELAEKFSISHGSAWKIVTGKTRLEAGGPTVLRANRSRRYPDQLRESNERKKASADPVAARERRNSAYRKRYAERADEFRDKARQKWARRKMREAARCP